LKQASSEDLSQARKQPEAGIKQILKSISGKKAV
jgi:hypothetical protein